MQQATIKKLNMSPEQYETLLFSNYAEWCESVTINDREFQKVLANASIDKWFMTEYAKCEKEFHLLTNRYKDSDTVSVDDLTECYVDCTVKMLNIRPTALLQEIKKTQAVGYTKVQGMKLTSLTFNQN
jgi:hypothetical protein